MRAKLRHVLTFLMLASVTTLSQPKVIIATETENGQYSHGKYKSSAPEYIVHYLLLESENKLIRTELIRIKTGDVIADSTEYTIIYHEPIGGKWQVASGKTDYPEQKVFTAFGKPAPLGAEILQVGETFFNSCLATMDGLFTTHGTVKYSISADENNMKMQHERNDHR